MFKLFIFLRKTRFRKKLHLNKMAFSLMFDWVSLFYTLALFGYIAFAILKEGDISAWRLQFDSVMGGIVIERIWSVITIIPLAMLFRSFQYPGVMFTSAERMVTILPNKLSYIWFLTAVSKWLKSAIIYILLGTILFLFSPSALSIIILYIFVLMLLNIVMTPIEWKFFQLHIMKKILLFGLVIAINILSILINSALFGFVFLIVLITISLLTYTKRFKHIDWKRVTSACDYKLWNMKIISRASKTSFKKDRQYSIWQRLSFWKKPFPYNQNNLYHRLWFIYFEKNIIVILQFFGAMLLLLFVFVFVNELIYFIGIAFVIHAFTSVIATFYRDRLTDDIVQILPWDVKKYQQSLYLWASISGTLFLLPFMLYVFLHPEYNLIIQFIFIITAFQTLFHVKVNKHIKAWETKIRLNPWSELMGYGLLICIIIGSKSTIFLYAGLVLCFIIIFAKVSKTLKKSSDYERY